MLALPASCTQARLVCRVPGSSAPQQHMPRQQQMVCRKNAATWLWYVSGPFSVLSLTGVLSCRVFPPRVWCYHLLHKVFKLHVINNSSVQRQKWGVGNIIMRSTAYEIYIVNLVLSYSHMNPYSATICYTCIISVQYRHTTKYCHSFHKVWDTQ